ncbi:polysaccharide biosynthesis transport protein [Sphingomonas sp. F9_3S_D5_B_2]
MNTLVPTIPGELAPLEYSYPAADPVPQSSSLSQFLAAIYRQRYAALAILAGAIIIGIAITMAMPRRYTAIASVQLDNMAPRVLADQDLDPQSNAQDAARFMQTQVDRLQSRNVAALVSDTLKADKSPVVLEALGVDGSADGRFREAAISKLQAGVTAELGLNTRIAKVEFTSLDPVVSARAANAFAEALAAANLNSKIETSESAKKYLTGQLAQAKTRLESSERQMLAYARSQNLTTTVMPESGDKGGSLSAQQLGTLTDSLSAATARRIEAQQRWQQVSRSSATDLPEVQDNKAVQDLVAQKAQLQAALQEDRQRHTEEYPSIRESVAKIKELDGQINALSNNIKSSFYGRYASAAHEEQQLAGTVGNLRGAAMSERERSVGYNSLSRQVETNRTFYEGLLQRYKEVAAASGAPSANVTVLDRALPPLNPSSPNVVRNISLAAMAGVLLALLFGTARDRMHDVVRSAGELEGRLRLPALGVVPALGVQRRQLALVDGRSAQSEAYHSIAVSLEGASHGTLPKTLLITSSAASEGKSTSVVGIAASFTAMGKRVLVVDADLRRPSLQHLLTEEGPGLADVLAGGVEPAEAIQRNEDYGFNVLGVGTRTDSPVTLLSSKQLRSVWRKLTKGHDIVIIDGPPVMGLADAVLLARSVEAVLVVVEANRVHSSQVDLAVSRLPGVNVLGAVLTKFDPKAAGVRYGGTDYYGY